MTGRRYYLTTMAAWQRLAHRCAETHFIVLSAPEGKGTPVSGELRDEATGSPAADTALILALITADEAGHIAFENDPEVESLPHPLSRTGVSDRAAAALAHLGVLPGDDAFTVAEKLGRVNPLLRHRVF